MVIGARGADDLAAVAAELPNVRAVAGDVTDSWHRAALADAVESFGGLHLLVNNASQLGPSPQPQLADYPLSDFAEVYRVNVTAPLALIQQVLPSLLANGGTVVNISSDAAVEAYPGWGGYGSAKAALDQLTAILGAEQPTLRAYAFDPGDMRTEMHQRAFPGEDISDRPEPESVVPSFLRLLEERPPSGRYRASDLTAPVLR
jgi:NAD(P)-dependent dehydrogenase (short-subunit alcohol dehydrogenase family)